MASQLHTLSATRQGRRRADDLAVFTLKVLPLAVALCFCPLVRADAINPGQAGLPMGGTVASGTVSNQLTADKLTLTQTTQRAVIDWASFNIAGGKTVEFVQPGASAAVLNRVSAGANMSEISGTLLANGAVLLMNPNGVMFHQGANINVGSLIATTGTVNPTAFMAEGPIAITGATRGSVTNQGSITAANAGLVALVAPSVSNQGVIAASRGSVLLGGVSATTISLNGGLYEFVAGSTSAAEGAKVSNSGTIQADGGSVFLTAQSASVIVDNVINMSGIIQARSLGMHEGAIVLEAAGTGGVHVSGQLDASGAAAQSGGRIVVTGQAVDLASTARLDASGEGGGTILVGGNWQGKGPERNATTTAVAQGAVLAADGGQQGNGGTVVVWADGETRFQGTILARGGSQAGDGGRVEVSGKQSLGFDGLVDASAAAGQAGSLLLDPLYAVISSDASGTTGDMQTINATALANSLSGTDVTVQADNRITVNALVDASANLNKHDLAFDAPTVDLNAKITLKGGASLSGTASTVNVNGSNASIQNGVDVAASGATVNVAAGTYTQTTTLNVDKSVTLAGGGQSNTFIDTRSGTSYGVSVTANDVTLRDFTVYGPTIFDVPHQSSYGIKVSPGSTSAFPLRNFTIRNVTSRGAGKAELDLNGVDGALIDGVTLNGAPVGNDAGTTEGAGLQLTDSANVTVRNITTLNNKWGGLALYQANYSYSQQVNNISVEGNNHFNELNPVYMQDESASLDFGTLNIAGFGYAVRNATNASSGQYTWLQRTRQGAYDLAVNVPVYLSGSSVGASYIQGWNGSGRTQTFEVGVGNQIVGNSTQAQAMTIATAVNQASNGATINLGAGSYNQQVVLSKNGLTLNGLDGAKLVVPDSAEVNGVEVTANNVTVQGLEIAGPLNGTPYYDYYHVVYSSGNPPAVTPANVSRGIRVVEGITGFTIRDNNIHDVRNGILVHGTNSTGSISDNIIENTKSGISVQYTDAIGVAIAGNSEGPIGNEWGVNLHLNIATSSKQAAPTLAWQQSLLDLSAANGGWSVQDQGYLAANRTRVNVVASATSPSNQGSSLMPIDTIQGGVNAVVTGGTVNVAAGTYSESVVLDNRYNLRFNDSVLQGLTINGSAANSGIGGVLTVSGAGGIVFNAATNLLSNTKLTASNGSIVFNGTLQSAANSLTLNASDSVSGTGTVRVPTLDVTAGKSVALALDVTSAEVHAGIRADLSGRAGDVGVDAPHGSLSGGYDKVRNTGKGVLIINGKSLQNEDVAPIIENIRVVPVIVLPPLPPLPPAPPPAPVTLHASVDVGLQAPTASGGPSGAPTVVGGSTGAASGGSSATVTTSGSGGASSGNGGTTTGGSASSGGSTGSAGGASPAGGRPAVVAAVSGPRQVPVTRSSAGRAGDSLDRGQGVEIDLSPGQ